MTTLQEYLNSKYTSQEEKKCLATELNIEEINREREKQGINEKLEGGELDLEEYGSLVRIKICGLHLKTPLMKLELGQKKYLTRIIFCHNQLTNLDLYGCPNLTELDGSNNRLSSIDLSKQKQLAKICLVENQITSIDFLKVVPIPEKLEVLEIYNNNIQSTTLDFLRSFVNLKDCKLGLNSLNKDYPCRIEENFYNRFYGSLEPIKNLTKLEEFCIAGTDVEEGIEYIPELITSRSHEGVLEDSRINPNPSIPNSPNSSQNQNEILANFFQNLLSKKNTLIKYKGKNNMERNLIDCQTLRPGAKVKKIQDELRPFNYDILAWQLAHPEKMRKVRPELFTNPNSKEQ